MASQLEELRRTSLRSLLFFALVSLVVGVLVAVPFFYAIAGGEFYDVPQVVAAQRQDSAMLFGPAYTYPVREYKYLSLERRSPSILVVGTSRSMKMRAGFFADPSAFYNGGGLVYTADEFIPFLTNMTSHLLPGEHRTVILYLDQYMFNDAWVATRVPEIPSSNSFFNTILQLRLNLIDVYMRILNDPAFTYAALRANNRDIGLNAKIKGDGFRVDGSWQDLLRERLQDQTNLSAEGADFRYTMLSIQNGAGPFRKGDVVSEEALQALDAGLAYAARNDIEVIGLFPPHAHVAWERLEGDPSFGYIPLARRRVNESFVRHGMRFYDFSDVTWIGGSDCEMEDGHHGSEKISARVLLAIAAHDDAFKTSLSPTLEHAVVSSDSCVWVDRP